MNAPTEKRLTMALAVICLAELTIIGSSWIAGPQMWAAASVAKLDVQAKNSTAKPLLPVKEITSYQEFVKRPLFSANRRAAPDASRKADLVGNPRGVFFGHFLLTGIVVTPSVQIAFVTDVGKGKSYTISEGDKLDEWTASKIERNAIVFHNAGKSITVPLRQLEK